MAPAIAVSASLTHVDVRYNSIIGDGASQLSTAVLGNAAIEVFNAVPIKEMRADSFTELDFYDKGIGVAGGMVVAGLILVVGSLTKILVGYNQLGDEGATSLCNALRESTVTKVQELSLKGNKIGPKGAKAVAAMAAVVGSLTDLNLSNNNLAGETEFVQATEVEGNTKEVGTKVIYQGREMTVNQEVHLLSMDSYGELEMVDLTGVHAIAKALADSASLTRLDVKSNSLGEEGRAVLRKAAEGRSGFELEL